MSTTLRECELEAEELMARTIDLLDRREQAARTEEGAARYRALRHRLEELREQSRTHRAREGLLPCPECGQWGRLWDADAGRLRCPSCGQEIDLNALHAVTGVWKLHLVEVIVFTGLAVMLANVCVAPASPPLARWLTGVGSALWITELSSSWRAAQLLRADASPARLGVRSWIPRCTGFPVIRPCLCRA